MIAVISPAKTLDFDSDKMVGPLGQPYFLEEAERINRTLKRKSRKALSKLQEISPQLASLNYQRNQEWNTESAENMRQAVLAFKGDVYLGLKAENWNEQTFEIANRKLLILSGLYGLLKPSDAIMPYRLEMGTPLKVGRRENLYSFWSDKVRKYFKTHIAKNEIIVNLASNEYFKLISSAGIPNPVLQVEFKDYSNGEFKVVSFFAKKARGMMANFIIQNNIDNKELLKTFQEERYYFDESSSSEAHYIFLRDKRENDD